MRGRVLASGAALFLAMVILPQEGRAEEQSSFAGRLSSPHAFVFGGTTPALRWEVGIERKRASGKAKDCLSAGIGRTGEGLGVNRICAPPGLRPLSVGSSEGEGSSQGSVVGIVTSPRAKELKVMIRGRPPRTVRVRVSSEAQARRAGIGLFGYAAVVFTGPGCLHRFVVLDASGKRLGPPAWGC